MKNQIILLLLILPMSINAQLIAGLAPQGTFIVQSNQTITAPNFSRDSVEIDLDCDLNPDLKLLLITGNPSFDAPHTVYAVSMDTSIKLCLADTNAPFGTSHAQLYELNDTMICGLNHSWQNIDNQRIIASSGGLASIGPHTATDTFFAFQKSVNSTVQSGWFNITLDLTSVASPIFTVQSYTRLCIPENVSNHYRKNLFSIYPSLSEGVYTVSSRENNYSIDVLNQMGQTVLKKDFQGPGEQTISISELANGHYFVRYQSGIGQEVIRVQKY